MKLGYETIKQYSGLQTVVVQIPLDNNTYADVEVKKFFNTDIHMEIFFTMGKVIEAFGEKFGEEEISMEDMSTHALTIALLHSATDIEMPPIEQFDQTLEMYQWLSEAGKLEIILSAFPSSTLEGLSAFIATLTARLGELDLDALAAEEGIELENIDEIQPTDN